LGDKTPKEAFTGLKPKIGHLRIFGFPVYIHVPMEKRTKLDPSREKGIFVGYSKTSKAYKIFILAWRKTVVSIDVKFEENLASRKSHELLPMAEDEEKEAPKGEQCSKTFSSWSQPSGGEEELAPSSPIKRPKWFMQTLKDAQKHVEAPRSTFGESKL
jgi:hypothetical protein